MNLRILSLVAAFIALQTPGCSAPTAAEAEARPKPAGVASSFPLAELKPGMPAAAMQKLLGKPNEVRPMKAPEGKAEVWAFTHELGTHIERLGFPSADIITYVMGSDGKPIEQKVPGPVRYQNVQHISEETVEVLLFNDQYVTHKVSRAVRQVH